MSTAVTRRAGRWLATADPDPERPLRWWEARRIALLPLGRVWDAVQTTAVAGNHVLAIGVDGPVVCDTHGDGTYYFLVPPGTRDTWSPLPDVECLGDTCYLSIPAPEMTAPPGVHWRQSPDGSGVLVDVDQLRAALSREVASA